MFSLTGFIKGFLLQDENDRTKQLAFEIDPSATTGTRTTIIAAQTADRTITLPDSDFDFNTTLTEDSVSTLTNKTIDADLNTISNIDNNEIKAAAAIALNKLAALTASRVLQSDGSGFISASAVTNTTLTYLDATSSIQTQLNAKVDDTDVINIAHGGTGQTTKAAAFDALSPMTTGGDLIYGGASGTGTRLANGSAGQVLTSNGGTAAPSWGSASSPGVFGRNFILNSDFAIAQRNTTISGITNGQKTFTLDRWYAHNAMGSGQLTVSQAGGALPQSKAALSVFVSANTSSTTGARVAQTLENADSLLLNNQTISFSAQIFAIGAVDQIELQFVTNTTNNIATNTLGSPVTFAVNNASFTLCKLEGVAVGTLGTTSTIGIRITATGASSGQAGNSGNGFYVEQAMLNIGSTAATWMKAYPTYEGELNACMRFYEKSYNQASFPAALTFVGSVNYNAANTNPIFSTVIYKVPKRTGSGTLSTYDPGNGSTTTAADRTDGTSHQTIVTHDAGENGFNVSQATVVNNHQYAFQWAVDAELT